MQCLQCKRFQGEKKKHKKERRGEEEQEEEEVKMNFVAGVSITDPEGTTNFTDGEVSITAD